MAEKLIGGVNITGNDLNVSLTEIKGGEHDGEPIIAIHSGTGDCLNQWLCLTEQSADVVIKILQKFKRIIKLKKKEMNECG